MFSETYEHVGSKRRGINSVEHGIAILQAVVELKKASSLKEIARKAEMDPSQTHRYVSSLVNCGMLRQDPSNGHYDLGPTALRTGLAALARQDSLSQVEEGAERLCQKSSATVLVAVWGVHGPTIIRWYPGAPPVYTVLSIGSTLPVTTSSTGNVFLAFLPDNFLNPFLKAEGIKTTLQRTPELQGIRDRIRVSFVARVDNTVIPGLRAYSAPVLGADQHVIAALTVVASEAIPRTEDAMFLSQLKASCRELTMDLGGTWTADV